MSPGTQCLTVAILVALGPTTALAQWEDGGPVAVGAAVDRYFAGEKSGGAGFAGLGVASVAGGATLLAQSGEFSQGMGYPLAIVGALQLTVGAIVWLRTDAQVARLKSGVRRAPAELKATETRRMEGVLRTFGLLEAVEIVLVGAGGAMALAGHFDDEPTVAGVGAGLAISALATFVLDVFAERRASSYLRALRRFAPKVVPGPDGSAQWQLGLAGRF